MKILRLMQQLCLLITALAFTMNAKATHYLSLAYGTASSKSDSNFFDDIDGSTIALAYGIQRSENFAWEGVFRKTSFDKSTDSLDLTAFGGGTLDLQSELDVMFFGLGFRYFFSNTLILV